MTPRFFGSSIFPNILAILQILLLTLNQFISKTSVTTVATLGLLPKSSNLNGSFDMILVVICHLTSLVHLIPTKQTYHAKDIAEVMFYRVYKHHRMPKHIVSDQALFTSTFWKRLNDLTDTESDDTTEQANLQQP
jgi:hypothetical protein